MDQLTVAEARATDRCRICGASTDHERMTYNFGREYAHTSCLRKREVERENAWKFEMES
jgi:hypothetical protein